MSEENFFVNKFLYFQEKNQDDYFYNSLIYIFEHNKNGALGIVMNKVIPISENIIFKSLKIDTKKERKNLLNGGPVDMNKLFVIHNNAEQPESLNVTDGLCLTSSLEVLENIGYELNDLIQQGVVKVIIIPDIESVNYGRGVGYDVIEHEPPNQIKKISATNIRSEMRRDGKL